MKKQGADLSQILGQWKRERPDIDPSCMVVCGAVWRAGKRLNAGVSENLKQYDLDFAAMDVLLTLRRNGCNNPMKPSQMAQDMMLSTAAMTARLDRLEARGLLIRENLKTDRRSVAISLSDEGRHLADKMVVTHVATEQKMLEKLNEADQKTLLLLLEKLAVD
ncbi:MarR family winged helix-turn-helix transcriptional regulator [Gymnodinialimonas hymeniacidonis]|uniref:MarR family winged helix-turn-helix transcriptional regulator n=1 Tax=Gymnodinialimonas hymeniacidonis TaxID=3126508 RepID=UPI0034C67059